jgi:aldehyde dehydrogenase (NAD+)
VLSYIDVGREDGATLVCGGSRATGDGLDKGYFVHPTIFDRVTPDMRIAQEEVFGPVLSIIPFDSDDDALAIANHSIYGLAAGVWTASIGRALRMAHELEAGTVWTNTYRVSSPLSPFGGYKRSGFGRESGLLAIREFVQEKSVWIETTGADTPNPFVIR